LLAEEGGPGWGNIIIVLHAIEEHGARKYLQSYYAHVDEILVKPKQNVRRGEQIATVGTADGKYWAHLHFEMRAFTTPFIGPGYRDDTLGWIDPSAFIASHRGAPEDDVGRGPVPSPVP
jgi:murein DD-endopeptidase MepM/ murein hydrolase activator NlpD